MSDAPRWTRSPDFTWICVIWPSICGWTVVERSDFNVPRYSVVSSMPLLSTTASVTGTFHTFYNLDQLEEADTRPCEGVLGRRNMMAGQSGDSLEKSDRVGTPLGSRRRHMLRSRSVGSFVLLSALAVVATVSLGAGQFPEVAAPMPAVLRDYPSVTADRLKHPETGNW